MSDRLTRPPAYPSAARNRAAPDWVLAPLHPARCIALTQPLWKESPMRHPIRFAPRLAAGVAVSALAALAAGVLGAGAASAPPADGQIRGAGAAAAITDSSIAVF